MDTIEQLLELQEHDLLIQRIELELKDIPERKSRELERLNNHQAALQAAEEALQARQAELKQHELEVQAKKDKISKLRVQQMDLKTNKEFQTMSAEIETIEKTIRRDEDSELAIMETIENAREDVAQRRQELTVEESVVQDDITALDERLVELEAERKVELEACQKAQQGIEPNWLRRYEAVIKSKRGTAALVSAEGGVCGGCHMALPPYQQHAARKRQEMVICGYCGRLLY